MSRVELYPDGTTSDPVCVLSRSYHLSYPFVFAADEEWYMLPETDENRGGGLYRAVRLPGPGGSSTAHCWPTSELSIRRRSSTVEGRGSSRRGTADGGLPETLSLYSAESLMSSWRPHPQRPDSRRHIEEAARPAGS